MPVKTALKLVFGHNLTFTQNQKSALFCNVIL